MSIIHSLNVVASNGAEKPLQFWMNEYNELKAIIKPSVESIYQSLAENTSAKTNVAEFITALNESQPNEYHIAASLLHLSDVFLQQQAKNEEVGQFLAATKRFFKRASAAQFNSESRRTAAQNKSQEQIHQDDVRLFQSVGMLYCLEYYLMLYKSMQDAPSKDKKNAFVENKTINLGFGNVPGLRSDIEQDEVLHKFIDLIQDNVIRTNLNQAYYAFKQIVQITHDNNEIQAGLKDFLVQVMTAFESMGIMQLSSFFFKPYGEKPLIQNVINQL